MVKHGLDEKIIMMDQIFNATNPEFERLTNLGIKYRKEQDMMYKAA